MSDMHIRFEYQGTRIQDLDEKMRAAIVAKVTSLTDQLYLKVIENVSGKILKEKTGALSRKIQQRVEDGGNTVVGVVEVENAGPKEWALEKGGKDFYPITPVKANILHFFGKNGEEFFVRSVNHPPSLKFAYLASALEEMRPQVLAELKQTINEVLRP